MTHLLRSARLALVAALAFALAAPAGPPPVIQPPNWRGGGAGTTTPDGTGTDFDVFTGRSSHLGRIAGAGSHFLNPDFSFVGEATWTAANGDELHVTYDGQLFLSGDPDFPFAFVAELRAVGGTGRFADAQGVADMFGAFTGSPGEFYYDFAGTLTLNGG